MVKFQDVKGLTDSQVKASLQKHGDNSLPEIETEGFFDKLKENFEDPLIKILMVALIVTGALAALGFADWLEAVGIAVAVLLATMVATYSEYKNETSFRALQEQASQVENNVFRNGNINKILVSEIVVGDYILLQPGDKIPADGKLIHGDILVDQSTLNGEQEPVSKTVAPSNYSPPDPSSLDDEHLVFRGAVVDDGEAVLIAEQIGTKTVFGKLHLAIKEGGERESPLQTKLSNLADNISTFGYVGATSIAISFLFKQFVIDQQYSMDKITSYLSLANWQIVAHDVVTAIILAVIVIVVAVPEGLPMMIAIVLSLNMRKLLKAEVLVRKLMGIETAGSLDILFVDKTGTLTRGVFEAQMFITGDGKSYKSFDQLTKGLQDVVSFTIRESASSFLDRDGKIVGGNSSDRALLSYLSSQSLVSKSDAVNEQEIGFNSQRKFSATQLKINTPLSFADGKTITLVKGTPDLVLPACNNFYNDQGKKVKLTSTDKIFEEIDIVSKRGIRVIAIATSDNRLDMEHKDLPSQLSLVGVLGIRDDIRKESKGAIEEATAAGIQVVMITGDRKETAVAVATELGLLKNNKTALTSSQLESMTDSQIQKEIKKIGLIARALPTDKSRLVNLCKELNLVVGMTGDGVNDSAALKNADVGFAMGSGSEVAKEASDIVILDDNFSSITQAVLYGRTIFKSIRKFIVFQSTVNAASMTIVFLGPFLGFDFPLTLIQLLWVNLVMDTLAAMAFGGEPALRRYMNEKPIKRDDHIITPHMWSAILINGLFIAFLCIVALLYPPVRTLFVRNGTPSEPVFLTAFFAFFIFLTNFNAFNARTPNINIFDNITGNIGFVLVVALIFAVQITFTYVGGSFLRTEGLTIHEWFLIIGASMLIIPFDTARKILMNMLIGDGSSK
eukprot:TRINITY_DN3812_c0_g1_i1.p1 TRINITY_DN3812_c0_g1~~TRINITY_DN3812_c0_g1_i1.p1  ORF type:complete len:903 (-),score=305.56 TRINITY_DN3812_c0_g1_i1:98-2806(-)